MLGAQADVKKAFKAQASETLRRMGARGVRQDGRATDEVRPISIQMSPLPGQVHGSVLFTRGETQALVTTTLGDSSMGQRYEDLTGDQVRGGPGDEAQHLAGARAAGTRYGHACATAYARQAAPGHAQPHVVRPGPTRPSRLAARASALAPT